MDRIPSWLTLSVARIGGLDRVYVIEVVNARLVDIGWGRVCRFRRGSARRGVTMRQGGNRGRLVGVCARSRTRATIESEDPGDATGAVSTIVGVLSKRVAIVVAGVLHKEIIVEVSESGRTEEVAVGGAHGRDLSKRTVGSLVYAAASGVVARAHLVVTNESSRAWVSAHAVGSRQSGIGTGRRADGLLTARLNVVSKELIARKCAKLGEVELEVGLRVAVASRTNTSDGRGRVRSNASTTIGHSLLVFAKLGLQTLNLCT
jgi:hypothetical protein